MTLDAETFAHRIVECLSDTEVVQGGIAINALLMATVTTILIFSDDPPEQVAARFSEMLLKLVEQEAIDFPEHLKAGHLQ